MDRRLILAVAGSGKTSYLISPLDEMKRFLVVTYTDNNLAHLRRCILNRFGHLPQNITLLTYFQFLYRVCYRPFLKDRVGAKGLTWDMPSLSSRRYNSRHPRYYLTDGGLLYHNRLARLCLMYCVDLIKSRIEKFYDCFMIDEVQDIGGHDFNLIQSITPQKIDCLYVGDFYQHTFDTSRDGNTNPNLHKEYDSYLKKWKSSGLLIDEATLSRSYRCSPTTCEFVLRELGIHIESHRQDSTRIVFVEEEGIAESLFRDDSIVKLFYKESDKYSCRSENWGASKGLDDFQDVCIVLNKTTLR